MHTHILEATAARVCRDGCSRSALNRKGSLQVIALHIKITVLNKKAKSAVKVKMLAGTAEPICMVLYIQYSTKCTAAWPHESLQPLLINDAKDRNAATAVCLTIDWAKTIDESGAFEAEAAHLEVQVVDGAISPQGVVAQPEVWVAAVLTELQSQAHGPLIHKLCQTIHDTRHQQNMAVLDGADIDEHQVGTVIGWRSWGELWVVAVILQTSLVLEKNFLLQRFLEVELLGVPRLANLCMHCKGEMTTRRSQYLLCALVC